MDWLSKGAEELIGRCVAAAGPVKFDAVVIGSGYGGAVAACRIASTEHSVCVLERGREYVPGEFPEDISVIPRSVRFSRDKVASITGEPDALFDFRLGEDVSVLVGSAIGGTSQINANVAERAQADAFQDPRWPAAVRADPALFNNGYVAAERMLGANPLPEGFAGQSKLRAIEKLNRLIDVPGTNRNTRFKRPPLAVTFGQPGQAVTNPQGVEQKACVHCGNCVTGCNHWAKNTLSMNYLAEAFRHGAELFNRAAVLHVEPHNLNELAGWLTTFRLNSNPRDKAFEETFQVFSEVLVLAAGTLGSTEILMRSHALGKLPLSRLNLGERFSSNGDMLTFGYDQDDTVDAFTQPDPAEKQPPRKVGPTITGMIDLRTATEPLDRIVVEEAAIPTALAQIAAELVTTTALPHQLVEKQLRGDMRRRGVDPLAVDPAALERTQVHLVMGREPSDSKAMLTLAGDRGDQADQFLKGTGATREGWLQVSWPEGKQHPLFGRQERILERCKGLGALHVPNPAWKPLPETLSGMLSGPSLVGPLFTVHPLGGCAMGDRAENGVVNVDCRVFSGNSGEAVHTGLYVMDGSVVPGPVGVNPFLTIAAIAERAIDRALTSKGWAAASVASRLVPRPPQTPTPRRAPAPDDATVALKFEERMVGTFEGNGGALWHPGRPLRGRFRLDVRATIDFGDIHALLRDEERILPLQATLRATTEPLRPTIRFARGDSPAIDEWGKVEEGPLLAATGSVRLLWRYDELAPIRFTRAFFSWWRSRGSIERKQRKECPEPGDREDQDWWSSAGRMIRFLTHAGEKRVMRYRLDFTGTDGQSYVLWGDKRIEYADGANLWRAFEDLHLQFDKARGFNVKQAEGVITLDLADVVRRTPPQILKAPDAIRGWLGAASLATFFLRLVFKTFFFEFKLPDYPRDNDSNQLQTPEDLSPLERMVYEVTPPGPPVGLTRYRHPDPRDEAGMPIARSPVPVVLIHGFAHSSRIFATEYVPRPLVRHLCDLGFDVWLLDLPTSTARKSRILQSSFDAVAEQDVRPAIDRVLDESGAKQVDVIAHCMGAAVFSMAVLSGKLGSRSPVKPSPVRRAILSQISPFIVGSPSNQLRSELAAFLRDVVQLDHIDVSARKPDSLVAALGDRVASTYWTPDAERNAHATDVPCPRRYDIATCNRITAVFGRNWNHRNLAPSTHKNLHHLLGYANMRTFSQIVDFVQRRRVVFEEGINLYYIEQAIKERFKFPVLSLHGADSDVFDPLTSIGSARRFQQVNGKVGYFVSVYPGYGHLDLWIGKDAPRDVYPDVVKFLEVEDRSLAGPAVRQEGAPEGSLSRAIKAPAGGPVVGWVREQKGVELARVWWSVDESQSDVAEFGVALHVRPDDRGGFQAVAGTKWPVIKAHASTTKQPLRSYCLADLDLAAVRQGDEMWVGTEHPRAGPPAKPGDPDPVFAPSEVLKAINMPATDAHQLQKWLADFQVKERVDLDRCRIDTLHSFKAGIPWANTIGIAVGSCAYPGSALDATTAQTGWQSVAALARAGTRDTEVDQIVLCGDQVYADATAGVLDTLSPRRRVFVRYEDAWRTEGFRRMASAAPVAMAIDDHEIWDAFEPSHVDGLPQDAPEVLWAELAFGVYQASHGPLGKVATMDEVKGYWAPGQPGHGLGFSQTLTRRGFGIYVLDTRTTRLARPVGRDPAGYQIMAVEQMASLVAWLKGLQKAPKYGDRPKFVVSGSVIAPFWAEATGPGAAVREDDAWQGYPGSLNALIDGIVDERINNVVFLSGDYHCALNARLEFHARNGQKIQGLQAFSVVASALYAPIPFANKTVEQFHHGGNAASVTTASGNRMSYSCGGMSNANGFSRVAARLDAKQWRIVVECRDVHGDIQCTTNW